MNKQRKTWETTGKENLIRNVQSGKYYGRFTLSGKTKWYALKTDKLTVARIRLARKQSEVARLRLAQANVESGTGTVRELLAIYRERVTGNRDIGETTRERYLQLARVLEKTWPDLGHLTAEKVTKEKVIEWRNRIRIEGTGFVNHGAKGRSANNDGTSAATINKAVDVLRRVLDIAVERGQIAANPLAGRGVKLRVHPHKPQLPDAVTLNAIFADVEKRSKRGGWGIELADFCRFLAWTGCRLSEANAVTWQDVDFARGILRVHGTKTDSAEREVPLVPEAKALLERIHARRVEKAKEAGEVEAGARQTDKVLAVSEVAKSLAAACAAVGVPKLTHHDLRDAFTTTAIESGVDVPTIAAWLGHADGGALLMRTYAHHRRAHSLAQAAKVNFGGQSHA